MHLQEEHATPLTVVQLLPALEGGGVERGTLEVAAELARRGHRSIVISGGGRLVPRLEAAGSRHLEWPIGRKSPLTLGLVRRLRTFLREQDVDIVHARSRVPAWIAYLALKGREGPARPAFVTTVHGLYSARRYSGVMTRGDRVIAVSDTVRDYIREHYPGTDPARVVVIHRGVDRRQFPYGYAPPPAWRAAWRASHPELRDRRVLALPGRLTPLKGGEAFLDLLARVRDGDPRVHGLVIGAARGRHERYAARLRERAVARGIPVTFTGEQEDVREIFSLCEVILSLSGRPESFGRTVLEALSLGIPVVGYAHGGVGEILGRVFPAGRVPPGDVRAAADRVSGFLRERPRVPDVEAYPLSRMLERTLALYADLARVRLGSAAP